MVVERLYLPKTNVHTFLCEHYPYRLKVMSPVSNITNYWLDYRQVIGIQSLDYDRAESKFYLTEKQMWVKCDGIYYFKEFVHSCIYKLYTVSPVRYF